MSINFNWNIVHECHHFPYNNYIQVEIVTRFSLYLRNEKFVTLGRPYSKRVFHDGNNAGVDVLELGLGGGAMVELLRLKLISLVHSLPIQPDQENLANTTTAGPNVAIG